MAEEESLKDEGEIAIGKKGNWSQIATSHEKRVDTLVLFPFRLLNTPARTEVTREVSLIP